MRKLKTKKEIDCYIKTLEHKEQVADIMDVFAQVIRKRGLTHDNSKLEDPEFEGFVEYTPLLAQTTYGSEEYQKYLNDLKPTLDAHYSRNRHHPEFYANGVRDMSLVDLLEMFADWYASCKRQNDGNIRLSIEKNRERFGYSKDLEQIFINTIELIENLKEE
jgi:hypothetical protein